LPDTVIKHQENLSAEELREACRVLKGSVLRQEVYANDSSNLKDYPYTVTEANFEVNRLQSKNTNRYAVFFAHPNTSISWHYERDPLDPRIEQTFTLEVDNYGNVKKSASVVYPRRESSDVSGQNKLHITVQQNNFINHDGNDFRYIGINYESKTHEIGGIQKPANNLLFDSEFLHHQLIQFIEIPFEGTFAEENSVQGRLLRWTQHYFWNEELTEPLSLNNIASHALAHHVQETVFSIQQSKDLYLLKFENNVNALDNELRLKGKYSSQNGYYWNTGLTQYYYYFEKFFLPFYAEDLWSNRTEEEYDTYFLIPVKTTQKTPDENGNLVSKFISYVDAIDYQLVSPTRLIDPNNNTNEVLLDELGMVITSSHYGDERVAGTNNFIVAGDNPLSQYIYKEPLSADDLLQQPHEFLNGVGHYFYYDLHAFKNQKKPAFVIDLVTEIATNNSIPVDVDHHIQIHITYSDGFGREIQSKHKVEPGNAFKRDTKGILVLENNKPVLAPTENRWQVNGRKVYNNKGNAVKQYEPFFSCTFYFENEKEVTDTGFSPVIKYDPLQRAIETLLPDGFKTKQLFTPWQQQTLDANDNMDAEDQNYVQLRNENFGLHPEQFIEVNLAEGLRKGFALKNMPSVVHLNTLGQTVYTVQSPAATIFYITVNEYDITGNLISITDARQYEKNKTRISGKVKNFEFVYDMQSPEKDDKGKAKE
ncbi:MAG: hypothetical protein IAF38_17045, partial [Bacteroidia bacterium]|nr:hypothetical protein [Bacteroidia bacterium]